MRILFLAPQPFYQERGTPIAVRLALQVLAERSGDRIDLLTYHEGSSVEIPGVRIERIKAPSFIRNVGPGISLRKLVCDVIFVFYALRLLWQARKDQYQLVHAVEEAVFVALLARCLFGVPYIYDMDSSLALQVCERWRWLLPLRPVLTLAEKLAVRCSAAVVPVCDALAAIAQKHGSKSTTVLTDISLLEINKQSPSDVNLRAEAKLAAQDVLVLYIGNLERYQGIDLLLESFALVAKDLPQGKLVIIGGRKEHIAFYQQRIADLGLQNQACLIGPRPVITLNDYLKQADILVSPRILGNNTPMKIYSYLHSGVPIVATRLFTHTQVLSDQVAKLVEPEVNAFSKALREMIEDGELRARIGQAARSLAESRYTFPVFRRTLNEIYDRIALSPADSKS